MPRVSVDIKFCKGCSLCVEACPKAIMALDMATISPRGYHPAHCVDQEACNCCLACVQMCPDVAIRVER